MFKTTRNLIFIFIIMVIVGFSLMVVAYSLPTENAHESILHDAWQFDELYLEIIPGYESTRLDLFTDALYLTATSYYDDNSSLIDNSMSVKTTGGHSFKNYVKGEENIIWSYSRYWGGYLVILKPFFHFFNYATYKILELFFELVLVIAIIKEMFDSDLKKFIIPFLLSLFLIHPEVIGLCIQFSVMFNIMLVSVYILLRFKEFLFKENRLFYYFLIIGMSTSFFDLLTYPLISFAIPMIFYLLLENDMSNIKNNFYNIILYGIVWSFGYIGMWVSKWVIASIILDFNVISDSINQLLFRTSSAEYSRIGAILKNLMVYKKKGYLIIFSLLAIYYGKRLIDYRKNITKNNLKEILPFLFMAVIPFLWYFVVSNHSSIHFWFTFRELLIFFFAIFCSLELIIRKEEIVKE